MRCIKGVRTRLVSLENLQSKNSLEIQKELKALLELTQESVAKNISIINQLPSSQSYLAGCYSAIFCKQTCCSAQ